MDNQSKGHLLLGAKLPLVGEVSSNLTESPTAVFLQKESQADYHEQWIRHLKQVPNNEVKEKVPLFCFRIKKLYLAMDVHGICQVITQRCIHPLPRNKREFLLGLVKLRGGLKMSISLEKILKIRTRKNVENQSVGIYKRMVHFGTTQHNFVVPVDEIMGVCHIEKSSIAICLDDTLFEHSFYKGSFRYNNNAFYYLGYNPLIDWIVDQL